MLALLKKLTMRAVKGTEAYLISSIAEGLKITSATQHMRRKELVRKKRIPG